MKFTLFSTVLLLSVLAVSTSCAPAPTTRLPAGQGDLVLVLRGFRSDHGQALVSLFRDERGFPDDMSQAWLNQHLQIHGHQAETEFSDLPFGRYAISVLHDEDLNGQMKTTWLGVPQEGFGFSGFPEYHWGRPGFDEAALRLETAQRLVMIKIRYQTGRKQRRGPRID